MFINLWSGSRSIGLLITLASFGAGAAERLPLAEHYTYERFKAYQGESFRVWGGEGLRRVIELKLERIEETRLSEKIEQFTLHFSGPADYQLDKNTYKFEHPQSGLFRLWIEPTDVKSQQQWYRADFNQLK